MEYICALGAALSQIERAFDLGVTHLVSPVGVGCIARLLVPRCTITQLSARCPQSGTPQRRRSIESCDPLVIPCPKHFIEEARLRLRTDFASIVASTVRGVSGTELLQRHSYIWYDFAAWRTCQPHSPLCHEISRASVIWSVTSRPNLEVL